ncbi:unnamed protein product [Lepeophtheirus salmonis]|uniref:(salmon louse) hypothetical protein n=1 Tax=Lepeophtheirus salmonis TaxID=72036 RepID=A0A7R8CLJ7_LEPSM|nr:unnamed protein product [Lepeophtheirus salmonis]CAF2858890.1 unnamed protein product [Lepeophtheirus salmonis]
MPPPNAWPLYKVASRSKTQEGSKIEELGSDIFNAVTSAVREYGGFEKLSTVDTEGVTYDAGRHGGFAGLLRQNGILKSPEFFTFLNKVDAEYGDWTTVHGYQVDESKKVSRVLFFCTPLGNDRVLGEQSPSTVVSAQPVTAVRTLQTAVRLVISSKARQKGKDNSFYSTPSMSP